MKFNSSSFMQQMNEFEPNSLFEQKLVQGVLIKGGLTRARKLMTKNKSGSLNQHILVHQSYPLYEQ